MVIGAPRSGTTWAANWLTTDTTLCLHDPLFDFTLNELDAMEGGEKKIGVSCTGLAMFPHWVNNRSVPKVILHRPLEEINDSLDKIGLPPLEPQWDTLLNEIQGWHVEWTRIFEDPEHIYKYLLNKPFDRERHQQLKRWVIEPDLSQIKQDPRVLKELMDTMRGFNRE